MKMDTDEKKYARQVRKALQRANDMWNCYHIKSCKLSKRLVNFDEHVTILSRQPQKQVSVKEIKTILKKTNYVKINLTYQYDSDYFVENSSDDEDFV